MTKWKPGMLKLTEPKKRKQPFRTYDQILAELKIYVPPKPKTTPAFQRSLAELFPEYDDEWATEYNIGITPSMFTSRNSAIVAWKCKGHGHFWLAQIANRTGKTRAGCPICSNNIIMAGFNDFPTTHPQVMFLWDWQSATFLPSTVSAGSNVAGFWKCDTCGHKWNASIKEVVSHGTRCPVCGGHELLIGFNDLATIAPELVDEFDLIKNFPFTPSTTLAERKEKIWWLCRVCGHSWDAIAHPRIHKGVGCPKCKIAHSKIQKRLFQALQDTTVLDNVEINVKLPVKWNERYSISWVDIYVEHNERRYVVEYDGGRWHADKEEPDTRKTYKLLEAGYDVIRVRDSTLHGLPVAHANYFELFHVVHHNFDDTVRSILDFIDS